MSQFSLDEQETILRIRAEDRSVVEIYSNDPVMQRAIERVGGVVDSEESDGGKFYRLPRNQVSIRKKPRKLTTAEKEQARERFQKVRYP